MPRALPFLALLGVVSVLVLALRFRTETPGTSHTVSASPQTAASSASSEAPDSSVASALRSAAATRPARHDTVPAKTTPPTQRATAAANSTPVPPARLAFLLTRWPAATTLDSRRTTHPDGTRRDLALIQPGDLPYPVRIEITTTPDGLETDTTAVAHQLLLRPADGVTSAQLAASIGATVIRVFAGSGAALVRWENPTLDDLPTKLATLAGKPSLIRYAEPDYIVRVTATPNDPKYLDGSLYGLHNTGQNSGTADADIDAPEAWDIRREAPSIIVAVIDTGINPDHEDLAPNLWVNPGEIAGDGIDNDANGYIDDVHGINSITGSGDPRDDHGHGSHCAGTVGARGDNNVGIAGVAWNVKLMGVKFLSASGGGAASDAIESVEYARQMGAHVLSNSWGGGPFSTALRDTIIATRNAGQIFVAAAANNSANNDIGPVYPASYDVDNIVAIAATTRTDDLADYSNYGQGLVHIAAPGSQILSASHSDNSGYISFSGTSMATPHVSGMLALIRAQYPTDNYAASINRLLNSADPKFSLAGKVSTGGRANLHTALTTAAATPFNDNFSKAASLTGSSINVRATNQRATAESGEPVHASVASATTTIWYSWVAPSTGTFVLNTSGSLIDTVAAVYTGSAVNALTPVASNDDHLANTWSRVEFATTIGTTYRIALSGKNAAQGLIRFALSGPPGEDDLANAINLPEFPANGTGSNVNATKQPGEPNHGGNAGGSSVWIKWTSPITGPVVAHTLRSNIDTLLAVYSGPASNPTFGALSLVAENDDYTAASLTSSLVRFHATTGTTYYFATDGKNGAQGSVAISIAREVSNDSFANRQTIAGDPLSITVNNRYATREISEPDHGAWVDGYGGNSSIWYSWTAPATGAYQIDTLGSTSLFSVSLYTGTALNNLVEIASDYFGGGFGNSRVILQATAGTTYIIALDSPDDWTGEGKLNLKSIVLAPNNDFASATTISGTPTLGSPVVVTGHNTGASQQLGEPGSAADTVITSVWWNWTAPATARYTLTTEGSDFDTVLGVYTGSAFNALTLVADDDDSGPNNTSRLSFDATAGTTYRIRVYGYGGATGNITLNLETWQPVANDSFLTPHEFTGTTYRHLQYTSDTTAESGEPAHAGTAASKSVWFTHTAAADGTLTLSTISGTDFPTRVAIYTGTAVNALTPVASNNNYHDYNFRGQVTWNATAGTTYRIAVDGDSGATGTLVTTFVVGPPNDTFANRTVLGSVSSHTETTYNHGATKDTGELAKISGSDTAKTLWWSWTAPSTGSFEITTVGSDINTVLGVFTGTAYPLTLVGSNDNIDATRGEMDSRVIVNATAGTTYQITVAGWASGSTAQLQKEGEQGEIKFTLRPFQKAANDNLAAATTIGASLPAFFETNNSALGIQTGESGTANSPADPNYDAARSKGTAWWKWTAPDSRRYHAATGGLYDVGAAENTILSVYTGPATSPTFGALALVAWDKDSAGGGYSLVSFDAFAGQTYYFQVGSESRGVLKLTLAPTPSNDHFAAAALLHGSSLITTGYNLGATFETGEPMIDDTFLPKYTTTPPRARSVWWRWVAPASGSVSLDTLGSEIFSVMAVYTGSSLGSLSLVVKDDWGLANPYTGQRSGNALVSFSATAGQTYYIQVEGAFSDYPSAGLITLSLEQSTAPTGNPFVTVAALPATATEGTTPGSFIISRTTAPATPLTVNFATSGTATNGTDYVALPATVTIPANAYTAELTLNALADGLLESNTPERVILTVQPGTGYQVAAVASATVSIVDPTSFTATAPVLTLAAAGANNLGLDWTFPAADHAQWRLQTAVAAPASQFLYDGFAYTTGSNLIGNGAWTEDNTGTDATIAADSLSLPGFPDSTGGRITFTSASDTRGAQVAFTSPGTVTDVFYSFLVRLDDVTAMSTSWQAITRLEAGATNGPAIFVRRAGIGAYDLGIHKRANGGSVETASALQNRLSGTTVLIVARYRTETGTNNDAMDIWVNPSSATFGTNTPPTANFVSVSGSDTTADWSSLALLAPNTTIGTFDELRIGSDWAAVTHLPWNTGDVLDPAETGVTLTGLTTNTAYRYRLRAESTGGSVVSAWSNTLHATTAATTNRADWLVQHFGTAVPEGNAAWAADPDGDGAANLLEYALATNPLSSGSASLPQPQVSGLSPQPSYLQLTFLRARADLTYEVLASSDLVSWSVIATNPGTVSLSTPVTVTDTTNLTTTPRRFLRLRVEFAP